MKTYIVKSKQHEKLFTKAKAAVKEAKRIGRTGVDTYVFSEVDGVREEDYFYSCTWGI